MTHNAVFRNLIYRVYREISNYLEIDMRVILASLLVLSCCGALLATSPQDESDPLKVLLNQAPGIKPEVLELALKANACAAKQGVVNGKNILTVIDFSLPSSQKRLWTFDLDQHRVLFQELVAHGKNSGENRTVNFSNDEGSLMSSLGVYVTDNPYIGKNGYSLRLKGLEKGFNDNVFSRAVVLHGAWYVSDQMIQTWGRLGRSYGCPAVRTEIATPLIDAIKNGSLLFAYYPEQDWLKHSHFLAGC